MTSKTFASEAAPAGEGTEPPRRACRSAQRGRTGRALPIAAAGALSLFAAACNDHDLERWPLPEEFTRDGSGKLADLIPGDWEVICIC